MPMNHKALAEIRAAVNKQGGGLAVIQHVDSIKYLTGWSGFLECTRKETMLIVGTSDKLTMLLPGCEAVMCKRALPSVEIKEWADDAIGWWEALEAILKGAGGGNIGLEMNRIHVGILNKIRDTGMKLWDCTSAVDAIRSAKTPEQLERMAKAGQVAIAIFDGARKVMAEGKAEWEVAMAGTNAGSAKAAAFMAEEVASGDPEKRWLNGESPLIAGDVPIINSSHPGCAEHDDHMLCVHQRASLRKMKKGDSAYFCCCNVSEYRGMHVGFDRTFFLGPLSPELRKAHDLCLESQEAALKAIKPGVLAEDVNAACEAVLKKAGLAPSYRTGRSLGYSILETPELREGDKTPLQEGMCFAVDGGVNVPGVGTVRIGDTVVVTKDGYKYLTPYEKGPVIIPCNGDAAASPSKRQRTA